VAAPKKRSAVSLTATAQELADSTKAALAARAALARRNPTAFCAHVLRDEETGEEIRLAPVHRAWHSMADQHRRVLVHASPGLGKTSMLSIGRVLFELGRNPGERIVVVSSAERQAIKVVRLIKRYIAQSQELREIADGRGFHLLEPGEQWAETAITVKRSVDAKDPSVQAFGRGGSIVGSRVDLAIIDDLLTYQNTRTQDLRDETEAWFNATVMSRLGTRSRIVAIGNVIHPDDLFHRWVKRGGWRYMKCPAVDAQGRPTWPERMPPEFIEEKRRELGPVEFARQMLCEPRDDADAYFTRAMFDKCLARGDGLQLLHSLDELPPGCMTVTGVDLGAKKTAGSGRTVLFTIMVNDRGERRVLNCQSGKWNGTEIIRRIVDTHLRYKSIIVVEDNAAQEHVITYARAAAPEIPVESFSTQGSNKHHPHFGVEGMSIEFSQGRWIVPNQNGVVAPEIGAWMGEFLDYQPLTHSGDRLMSSWFAREYARTAMARMGGSSSGLIGFRVLAGDGGAAQHQARDRAESEDAAFMAGLGALVPIRAF
jgi:hypothetical protein